jgi:hypothetical protein
MRRRLWIVAGGLILLLAVTLPARAREALRHANMANTATGLSAWQRGPDGGRFRWSGARSTFFVGSSGRLITIPIRQGPDAPPALEVRIS